MGKAQQNQATKREYSIPEGLNWIDRALFVSEKEYDRGDKTAILDALQFYIMNEMGDLPHKPIPKWLVLALFRALAERTMHNINSWDEVFGPPLKNKKGGALKGKHRQAARHKLAIQFPLFKRVEQLVQSRKRIDKGLFESVGKEFGVSGTDASDIYYKTRQISIIAVKVLEEEK